MIINIRQSHTANCVSCLMSHSLHLGLVHVVLTSTLEPHNTSAPCYVFPWMSKGSDEILLRSTNRRGSYIVLTVFS